MGENKNPREEIRDNLKDLLEEDLSLPINDDIPSFNSVENYSYGDNRSKSLKAAKKMMNSIMKLYLSQEIIEQNEYVRMKQRIEEMQLSSLLNQMAQMEHSIEMLMRTIESGELTPRMFEVLAGLQKTMLEINKHTTLYMMASEEGIKKLKHDIDIYSQTTTITNNPTKNEDDNVMRGNRNLMKSIQEEIEDIDYDE